MKKKAIIIDLDGTLADCSHRLHILNQKFEKGNHKWDAFFENLMDDSVNDWCLKIIEAQLLLEPELCLIYLTGRADRYREKTEAWIKANVPEPNLFLMRKGRDFRKNYVVKRDIYNKFIKDEYDVIFAIDDDVEICKMWKSEGIPALLCDFWSIKSKPGELS